MSLDYKCYVVELGGFIEGEFMITNQGKLLLLSKKGLETKVDKYEGLYYLVEYTDFQDTTGEKIYSSDIVETKYNIEEREYAFIGEIVKEKGCYVIKNDSNSIYLWYALEEGIVKVIGSKFDNKSKFKKLEIINNNVVQAIEKRDKYITEAVKRERINSIKKMIEEGIGKQFIINMYSEEEFKTALSENEF